VAPAELLRDVVERVALSGHEGKSGAGLERVRLADGRALVVKQITPEGDITLRTTGGSIGREHLLRRNGTLDRLPRGVGHAVVDSWVEGDATVVVMRDLGQEVLTWDSRLSTAQTRWVVERVARLHRAFLGDLPPDLAELELTVAMFAPSRIAPLAQAGNELMQLALHGWELFADQVPAAVRKAVFALHDRPGPLASALREGPTTLCHGDLATVNMAFEGDDLVLLDWAMPTAAPGSVDVARFLAGCWSVLEPGREEVLAMYADAAGPAYDARSMRLSLLAGLVWLGWNKALDAAEHPDLAIREREAGDLAWWVRQAETTLEKGDL
jgi:hypothetical protein